MFSSLFRDECDIRNRDRIPTRRPACVGKRRDYLYLKMIRFSTNATWRTRVFGMNQVAQANDNRRVDVDRQRTSRGFK